MKTIALKFTKLNKLLESKILFLILTALTLRIVLSFFGTLQLDFNTFLAWSNILVDEGFSKYYLGWSDYLPGYPYLLFLLGKINQLSILPQVLLYKLPAIMADLLTGFLIFKIARKKLEEKWSLILASLYFFNPAIITNSTLWGQVDSLSALFILLAVYLLEKNWLFSAITLSLGTLIKPQAGFILPVIIYFLIKNKTKIVNLVLYGVVGLAIFSLGFVPFLDGQPLLSFIAERLSVTLNQYPYGSVNAFNFWGLFGFWKSDLTQIPLSYVGLFLVSLTFGVYLLKSKNREDKYLPVALVLLSAFLFLTRMHERHLLPILAPLLVAAISLPNLILVYLVLSLTYVANLAYSYVWITNDFKEIFSEPIIKLFIIANLAAFSLLLKEVILGQKANYLLKIKNFYLSIKNKSFKLPKEKAGFPKIKLNPKLIKIFFVLIVVFAFFSRVLFLNKPESEYFDEVYHAFTARQMLNGNVAAWEWWNTPPEGFAYEWTHPPLAKLGMWLGMLVFGENAFGWRIPGALLGVGSTILVYFLAKKLFKDEILALIASFFFSMDGLFLTMSRIGMNDSYVLFFILLTVYLFLQKKNFLSAVAFGLALASKWSSLYCLPILFLIWLSRKKKFDLSLFSFAVVPLLIYLASYTPMFLTGHGLDIFWGVQKQMWWYHTGLKATHPYTSQALSWPFLIRPVYLYTSDEVNGYVARIYNLGNPAVFWFGLTSVIMSFYYAFIEKNKKLALVIFSYLIFFVPWMMSPRIMFFYHYLPAVPFMCLASGFVLRKNEKLILPVLGITLLLFFYFYPHWAGLQIPLWLDKSYYWLISWR